MTPAQRLDRCVLAVCQMMNCNATDLLAHRRGSHSICTARKHLYLACRATIPVTLTELSSMLGRDHSTITQVLQKFVREMDADPLQIDRQIHKHILDLIYSYPKPQQKEAA